MEIQTTRMTRFFTMIALASVVGACTLPRPGPTKGEILNIENIEDTETEIVLVDERITRIVSYTTPSGFPSKLIQAGSDTSDVIRPGDTLSLTVFENVDDGVLNRGNQGAATLQSLQVDEAGFIYVPYAGRIRAAGNTTEGLRSIVTSKLGAQTPEPQVLVQRAEGDAATVSVLGDGIASQGVYPIQRSSRRLMEMLATAGGLSSPSEITRVTVLRKQLKGEIWIDDVYDNPQYDIALRAGDRILVKRDPRIFTVLGATGSQANVPFAKRNLSALQALAQVGGLDGRVADPTGLFVIRRQSAKIVNEVLGRNDLVGEQSIIYVINLTEPSGFPVARDFDIRDGDTIYVTEAPFVQWTKTLNAITGTARTINVVDSVGE